MDKGQLLKRLFQLPRKDILDIYEILNGYKERTNKSNQDTLLMRCIFMNGYHSTTEYLTKNNITKDNKLATALNYETSDIKTYFKLKNILNIDNELFNQILLELEEGKGE